MDNTQEIQTTLAVLVASTEGMQEQLSRQNGALRADHDRLVQQGEAINTLCKNREDDRKLLSELFTRVRQNELALAKMFLVGSGTGGVVSAAIWAALNFATTGSVTP